MAIKIEASWYRGLRSVKWEPEGVSVLVGQNGAGKTTLLSILSLFSQLQTQPELVVLEQTGGMWGLINMQAPLGTKAKATLTVGDIYYEAEMGDSYPIRQSVHSSTHVIATTAFPDERVQSAAEQGRVFSFVHHGSLLADLKKKGGDTIETDSLHRMLLSFRMYSRYSLFSLRERGSPQSSDMDMRTDGANVFSLLRNWRDSAEMEERFDFVTEGLKKAFPRQFRRFDFESAQTIVFAAFRDSHNEKVPARAASDGMLTMLLHLCAIASAPDGGIVAIDEPENSLSPYGIRVFLEHTRARAAQKNLTVLLATHSPALLNHFKDEPENVWVLDPDHDVTPKALTELHDEEWLARFSIGDLYAREVVGAPPIDGTSTQTKGTPAK